MIKGTEKYQWARATFGSIGLVGLIVGGPIGLIVGGGCLAVGLRVKYKENHDFKAQLEDEEERHLDNRYKELEHYAKLKSLEEKAFGRIKIE
jgi:hypothetical protein